jgi:hypothetical protein
MQVKTQYMALIACVMLVIPATAFADPRLSGNYIKSTNPQYMQVKFSQVACKVNYTTGYLQDVIGINQTAFASLTTDMVKLNNDLTTLQGYVSSNNPTDFKSFTQGQLLSDVKSSSLDIKSQEKTYHLTKDQRSALKSDLLQLRENQKACLFSVKHGFVDTKVQRLEHRILLEQNRSSMLAGKGVDTTALNSIISSASRQITALESEINSTHDRKSLEKTIHGFCLYDGCKNGTNFHFAANSAIAVKQAELTKIQSINGSSLYSTQITQAQGYLSAAQSILNTVGTGHYSGSQQSDIWNNIKATSNIIKQLWHELGRK